MSDSNEFSRRNFFTVAGVVAGSLASGYAALAPATALAAVDNRSFNNVAIAVEVDGIFAGFAVSASGGGMEGAEIESAIGASRSAVRNPGSYRATPLRLRFRNMAGAKFAEWFAARDLVPRNVSVILVDMTTGTELYRLVMEGARIIEVGISQVSASNGTTPLNFEAVLFTETARHVFGDPRLRMAALAKAKAGATSMRLFFKGLEQFSPAVMRLDNIATRAKIDVSGQAGNGWTVDPLKFTARFDTANAYYQWLADCLRGAAPDRPGVLQLLGIDGRVAGTVDLIGPRLVGVTTPFESIGAELPGVEVQVVCSELKLNVASMIA